MIATIHQPQFMPWLGFYGKVACADALVLLDNVQFKKGEFQNRNRLRTPKGTTWLTVPVLQHMGQTLAEVEINNQVDWRKKHLATLRTLYSGTPGFAKLFPEIEAIYSRQWERLVPLAEATVRLMLDYLGMDIPVYVASQMDVNETEPTRRLIRLCEQLGASHYIAGINGPSYMDMTQWDQSDVEVVLHRYQHPTYGQKFEGFEPLAAAIDLAFNNPDSAMEIILKGNQLTPYTNL
jgi:WbqC-like protein family